MMMGPRSTTYCPERRLLPCRVVMLSLPQHWNRPGWYAICGRSCSAPPRVSPRTFTRTSAPNHCYDQANVWSIRTKLQIEGRKQDLALFNLEIDSKLRGCDLVAVRVDDIAQSGYAMDRATVGRRRPDDRCGSS